MPSRSVSNLDRVRSLEKYSSCSATNRIRKRRSYLSTLPRRSSGRARTRSVWVGGSGIRWREFDGEGGGNPRTWVQIDFGSLPDGGREWLESSRGTRIRLCGSEDRVAGWKGWRGVKESEYLSRSHRLWVLLGGRRLWDFAG